MPTVGNVVRYADKRADMPAGSLGGNGATYVQCGVTLTVDDERIVLTPDPVMSVSGHNVVVRRNVAKGGVVRGTIKESWREDDLSVQVAGLLTGDDRESMGDKVSKLLAICQAGKVVTIDCDYLRDCYGITKIVIEDYDFQHTKGLGNQQYVLKGYSDESYELLEKLQ